MTGTTFRILNGVLLCAASLAFLPGCVLRENSVPLADKAPEPGIDSAIVKRNFANTPAVYVNTVVIAGDTRFPFVPDPNVGDLARPIVEPVVFLANIGFFPVSLIQYPPFTEKGWRQTGMPPTYTANPSLDGAYRLGSGAPGPRPSEVPRVGP